LPAEVAQGICPACLLRAGLDPGCQTSLGETRASYQVTMSQQHAHAGRVLEGLASSIGSIPRVLLPDTEKDDRGAPVIKPSSPEMPPLAERGDRYHLFGEIARGGMGAILKGRDADLGRDLAVKVLLEAHTGKPDLLRRFVEEAQIGGQLQHPGIVPVYELGAFADRRPYFTMKLVKGRTLATLLAERASPSDELPRFLGIFEQVAQTVAYAHARGVIHRDLKPSNVMVGSFGEVQVMDWGLAKVLEEGGVFDDQREKARPLEVSVIRTVRSGSATDESQPGSVLGTPAYMAPEQAGGDLEQTDRRADVFGLGATLCEILTGEPPYTGRTSAEVMRKALRSDTQDAITRLDACGADAELIALVKECLASEPDQRPRHAGVVAGRTAAYLAGVQERLRTAELARVEAQARAEEEAKRCVLSNQLAREAHARADEANRRVAVERQRRRYQLGMAAAVLTLTTVLALAFLYWSHERQASAARVELALKEATLLRDQATALPDDAARWAAARRAVDAAIRTREREGSEPESAGGLAALRREVEAGLVAAHRDRALLEALADVRTRKQDLGNPGADAAYARAFGSAGLDVDVQPPERIGAALKARPSAVGAAATAALDDWALVRGGEQKGEAAAAFRRPLEAARAADPDSFRDKVRAALLETDSKAREAALRTLAADPKSGDLPPASAVLLASALRYSSAPDLAITFLRSVAGRHPDDGWINYELATALAALGGAARDEAVRYFSVARALRPQSAHDFAHLLDEIGRGDEALTLFADLVARQPLDPHHLACYGRCLQDRGSPEAAAILNRAAAAARSTIDTWPKSAGAHFSLGYTLSYQGKLDEAVKEYRTAIRLGPGNAEAHSNLGSALTNQEKIEDAMAEYRAAIHLKPDLALAHCGLAFTLQHEGKLDEAIAEYRTAIRLKPFYAEAHCNLAAALAKRGELAESLAMYRKGHELGSKRSGWPYPSARWVADAKRSLVLANRLPAVIRGEDKLSGAADLRLLAVMAYDQKRYTIAAQLWEQALLADPKLGDDREADNRYRAACAAALAAAGQEKDEPGLTDGAKAKLRQQARLWLTAELDAWAKLIEGGKPAPRAKLVRTLRHWQRDPDLDDVREPATLAKRPLAEQKAWQAFWDEAGTLLKKAQSTAH
jgi:serine/threonine-protein kinase